MDSGDASWLRRRRQPIAALGLVVLGALAYVVTVLVMNPWSRLYNAEQELDLSSGRARFTRHVLYFQAGRDVRDTPLSLALAGSCEEAGEEEWVKVNIFGLGTHASPHYTYHGAFG